MLKKKKRNKNVHLQEITKRHAEPGMVAILVELGDRGSVLEERLASALLCFLR